MLSDMLQGAAWKPFVYRTLSPTLMRLTLAAIPSSMAVPLNDWLAQSPPGTYLRNYLGYRPDLILLYTVAMGWMTLYLVGFCRALRYLIDGVYRVPAIYADCITLGTLALIPSHFAQFYHYPYDFSTLFLFTLGLALMARGRWKGFLAVYFLGCLNKETTILLTLIFMIYFRKPERMPRLLYWKLAIGQLAIFAAVKAGLSLWFWNNPGGHVEFHLFDHNLYNLRKRPYLFYFWPRLAAIIAIVVPYHWRRKPGLIKTALWAFPPLFILGILFGYLDEFRAYYEIYPIVMVLIAHSIASYFGWVKEREGKDALAGEARSVVEGSGIIS